MLDYLCVAIPKNVISREGIDMASLSHFERVTGIKKTRRYEFSTEDMIKSAIDHSHLKYDDGKIEAVIVVTQSPDRLSPCMAVSVHKHLKLGSEVPAFDINHACDGFIMGLWASAALGRRVLLICADRLRYNKTPIEGLIFSDSVSIAIVNPFATFPTEFYTDGSGVEKLYCGLNGEMDMDGASVFDFATTTVPNLIKRFMARNADMKVDWLVPHQANLSMNKLIEKRSGFSGRCLYSIEEYGNQSMNSIPMAIAENEKKIYGSKLLLVGFGAGYTAAAMGIRWQNSQTSEVVEI